jgi:hypothetical protein
MGMTNRVIPAQGEERGASYTLIRLDGDVSRKFQPHIRNLSKFVRGAGKWKSQRNICANSALNGSNVQLIIVLLCRGNPSVVAT